MTSETASAFRSGKSHHDENFPVASRLIHPRHRGVILAFYNFVRTADDIADHSTLQAQEKLQLLDKLELGLLGTGEGAPEATTLRLTLNERGLSPRHAQNILTAFRMDVTKLRYRDWADLMDYCSYSAMPVGRFVLDVHGEDTKSWPASDALCAALQIINHLQDCKRDYLDLDRVYIPADALASAGSDIAALGETRASPQLARCLHGLADRTQALLRVSDPLPAMVEDFRLSLEISVIQALAHRLTGILASRDPLSASVHTGKAEVLGVGGGALISGIFRRFGRRLAAGLHRPRQT
jgi:squalene synthase HpnC